MGITVKLEAFEGPLDLLLHLIKKNKMNIYDIQISPITDQYMAYIDNMGQGQGISLDSMSDFIVMAATLLLIKSKMLLPKPEQEDIEEDPRQELVMRLLEYKKMKHVSKQLKEYEKDAKKIFFRNVPIHLDAYETETVTAQELLEETTMEEMYKVFKDMMRRQRAYDQIHYKIDDVIIREVSYTVEKQSHYILDLIKKNQTIAFHSIFNNKTSKMEMIVTFMALLELVHQTKIKVEQKELLEDIWISGVKKDGQVEY